MKKYEIYVTNFGYFYDQQFDTIEQAYEYGKSKGFEFSVHETDGGKLVAWAAGPSLTFYKPH